MKIKTCLNYTYTYETYLKKNKGSEVHYMELRVWLAYCFLFCFGSNFAYFVACSRTVKPKNPTLSLNPSLVDGENSLSHSCTGNVGNPPGSLQIQIRRSADSNFTEYSTPRQIKSSSLESAGNCSYIKTLSFSIDLTSESWSNMTIRCVALNTVSLEDDDPVPNSILYTRTSISS